MARLFDNNTANYMSRASVNLGLDGATACSFAAWVKITAVNAVTEQRLIQKQINDGWSSIYFTVSTNDTTLRFSVQSETSGEFPTWVTSAGIGTGVWTRVLFAWARTGSAVQGDGVVYINGLPVSTSWTAEGYTNAFTIQETSNNLLYGIRPVTLTQPLNGALAWVCIWNRQLTAQEALIDYTNPRNVKEGLLSIVELAPDVDQGRLGGSMTVNGTLTPIVGPQIVSANPKIQNTIRPRPFAPGMAR